MRGVASKNKKLAVDVVSGVGEAAGCGGSVRVAIIKQLQFRQGNPSKEGCTAHQHGKHKK